MTHRHDTILNDFPPASSRPGGEPPAQAPGGAAPPRHAPPDGAGEPLLFDHAAYERPGLMDPA